MGLKQRTDISIGKITVILAFAAVTQSIDVSSTCFYLFILVGFSSLFVFSVLNLFCRWMKPL